MQCLPQTYPQHKWAEECNSNEHLSMRLRQWKIMHCKANLALCKDNHKIVLVVLSGGFGERIELDTAISYVAKRSVVSEPAELAEELKAAGLLRINVVVSRRPQAKIPACMPQLICHGDILLLQGSLYAQPDPNVLPCICVWTGELHMPPNWKILNAYTHDDAPESSRMGIRCCTQAALETGRHQAGSSSQFGQECCNASKTCLYLMKRKAIKRSGAVEATASRYEASAKDRACLLRWQHTLWELRALVKYY